MQHKLLRLLRIPVAVLALAAVILGSAELLVRRFFKPSLLGGLRL